MVDLRSILATHHTKARPKKKVSDEAEKNRQSPSFSEIPDLFFDEILVQDKLNRIEILVWP